MWVLGAWTGQVAFGQEVKFSADPGLFSTPFNLSMEVEGIADPEEVGTIRYTTNGAIPNRNSTTYIGPVRLAQSAWIRARYYSPDGEEGPVTGGSYLRVASDLMSFSSNLPILVLHSFQDSIVADVKRPAYLNFFDVNPITGRATLNATPDFQTRTGAELRGSSSLGFPKNSMGVETRDENDEDESIEWLGLPDEADWVFYAPYTDKTLMRNALAYELSREMGRYAPNTRFVELYVKHGTGEMASRDYMGVYVVTEKIKRDRNRVDIDPLEPDELSGEDVTGGYIFKKDRLDPGDRGFNLRRAGTMAYVEPKEREIPDEQSFYLRSYLTQFETALYGANFRHQENGYAAFIDPLSFIDQHILVEACKNIDGYRLSSFYHKDRNGKLKMGPAWDYNLSLGNANYLEGWRTNGWYYPQVNSQQYPWFERLFEDPDFEQQYVDRWAELRETVYNTEKAHQRIDELVEELDEAQNRNFSKWRVLGTYVWPNWFIGRNYMAEIGFMKEWIEGRWAWMDSQFVARPIADLPEGQIEPGTFVNLETDEVLGRIYFTLDGTDPRAPGGAPVRGALTYQDPIPLNATTQVFARVRIGDRWSAPLRRVYYTSLPEMRISEIHYHPQDPVDPDSSYSSGDFEFVELENIGETTLDLAGVQIRDGIDLTIEAGMLEPGEFGVVVSNAVAFRERYSSEVKILGTFDQRLDNAGESLRLIGPLGEPIQMIRYDDVNPWPLVADGEGFSLVPAQDWGEGDPTRPEFWRASAESGGSPGRRDPTPNAAPVWITEVFPNPGPFQSEGIELYNPNAFEVDISGWYLSDDENDPQQAVLPMGTVIGSESYLWIGESVFDDSFGLSSGGETVYLFSANSAGDLTGYNYAMKFRATPEGSSWGTFETGAGLVFDFLLERPSPAEKNAAPEAGPVVFSEVVFNRGGGVNEPAYVEIKNISAEPVILRGDTLDASGWTFWLDGVRWDFPINTTLPSNGLLILTPVSSAMFRAAYSGVDPSIIIDNVFMNRANSVNWGTEFMIAAPWPTETDNLERVVEVDRLDLDEFPYWPPNASEGTRYLERRNLTRFAGDPNHWFSSVSPTPGVDADSNRAPWIEPAPTLELTSGVFPQRVVLRANVTDDGRPEDPGRVTVEWELSESSLADRWIWESQFGQEAVAWIMGPGEFDLNLTAFDGSLSFQSQRTVVAEVLPLTRELVPSGDAWNFLDTGATDLGNAWTDIDFDDSGWNLGVAELGYGDGDEVTEVGFGPVSSSKFITTYFRKSFEVLDPDAIDQLRLHLLRDDGAVVYLNGVEAIRSNMPEGEIDFNTFALTSVAGVDETVFESFVVPADLLQSGSNQLAVEIHQFNRSSSDISFDLRLEGDFAERNQAPFVSIDDFEVPVPVRTPFLLEAEIIDDGAPGAAGKVALQWTKLSGPGNVEVESPNLPVTWTTVSEPGTYRMRITVSDGSAIVSQEIEFQAGEMEYALWAESFFSPLELQDPNVSGPEADPDQDGASNAEEYLAGTHPWDPLSLLSIQLASPATSDAFRFHFTRLPGKDYEILKGAELSNPDLQEWSVFERVDADPELNGPEEYQVVDQEVSSSPGGTPYFFRIRIPGSE